MKLSIYQYAETGEPIVLSLRQGAWAGRKVAISLEACGDPTCDCAKVDFHCRVFAGADLPSDDEPAIVFALDGWARRVADPEAGDLSHEARSLGKAVMAEFEEADWQSLLEFVSLVKREMLKTADLSDLEVEFPPEIMEGDDDTVGYGEIFPYAELAAFELGACKWVVDDQYCVDPECDSTTVELTFLGTPKDASAGGDPAAGESMPAVLYDYRSGRVEEVEVEPQAGQPAVEALLQAARAANQTFDADAAVRHRQVRELLQKALHRHEVAPAPVKREQPKIGRNDPCPCGSGEKYKKCFGMQAHEGE